MGSPTAVSRSKPTEIIKKMQEQVAIRQKYRSHQVGMFMTHCLAESRIADHVLTKHKSDNNLTREKVIENIRNQESPDLEARAEARRRRSGTPSNKLNRTLSFRSPQQKRFENFQDEVERVMEKCAEERDAEVKIIKKKYKDEIKTLKTLGNEGLVAQVIGEMKIRLKAEIEEVESMCKARRKEMVEDIKAKYA